MSDNKGFKVSDAGIHNLPLNVETMEASLHAALDIIIGQLKDDPTMGGAKVVITAKCGHDEHEREFSLAVYESSGQKDCVWCNGTGVEGS